MRNEDDLRAKEIVRQARPAGFSSRMNAGGSGTFATGGRTTSTNVGNDGKVRRRWLVGSPWTDDFYFVPSKFREMNG
jgi:hypothetical protein